MLAHEASYWVTWFPGSVLATLTVLGVGWRLARRASKILDKLDDLDALVKTNHGKTIGQHVEAAATDARKARKEAKRVRKELTTYKAEQATRSTTAEAATAKLHDAFTEHAENDLEFQAKVEPFIVAGSKATEEKP